MKIILDTDYQQDNTIVDLTFTLGEARKMAAEGSTDIFKKVIRHADNFFESDKEGNA